MDNVVDSLEAAHREFIAASAAMLEAKKASIGDDTTAINAALENLKQKYELFRVACDKADAFVESAKQRIGSECLVNEAAGSVAGHPGLPPINAVRLEQLSKAVRLLVLDLQQGSSGGGAASSNGGGACSANGGGAGSSNGGGSKFNEDGGQ